MKLPKCPFCLDGILDYKIIVGDEITHAYICDLCPIVAFEYYDKKDTSNLNKHLEKVQIRP